MTHVKGADNGIWRSFGASQYVGFKHSTNFPRFHPNGTGFDLLPQTLLCDFVLFTLSFISRDSYIFSNNGGLVNIEGRSELQIYKDSLRSEVATLPVSKFIQPAQRLSAMVLHNCFLLVVIFF